MTYRIVVVLHQWQKRASVDEWSLCCSQWGNLFSSFFRTFSTLLNEAHAQRLGVRQSDFNEELCEELIETDSGSVWMYWRVTAAGLRWVHVGVSEQTAGVKVCCCCCCCWGASVWTRSGWFQHILSRRGSDFFSASDFSHVWKVEPTWSSTSCASHRLSLKHITVSQSPDRSQLAAVARTEGGVAGAELR